MPKLSPVDGVSIERFAALAAKNVGLSDQAQAANVEAAGLEWDRWNAVQAKWTERLQAASQDSKLGRTYARLFREALTELCGGSSGLDFDDYVSGTVEVQLGRPLTEVVNELGYDMKAYLLAGYEWNDRLQADPKLMTYYSLRVQQGWAQRTGQAPKLQLEWLPGQMVRSRRCHRCGAMKVTPPRTSWVYCDYCATLFDYDPLVAVQDPRALDHDDAWNAVRAATAEEVATALRAGDKAAYGPLIRWRYQVLMEVCPESYSPRVRDSDYRQRMLDDVIVPEMIATRFDERHLELFERAKALDEQATKKPSLARILQALEAAKELWQHDAELLQAASVFDRHPDEVDASLYLFNSASGWTRGYLGMLANEDEGAALLEAAGVACEYVALDPPPLHDLGCGHCGAKHRVPGESKRRVCESCGHTLDVAARSVPCRSCGARISISTGPTRILIHACSYCDAHISL